MRFYQAPLALAVLVAVPALAAQRTLQPDDIFALESVGDPRISPEGTWVAYTVGTLDAGKDSGNTDLFMVRFAGGEATQLTHSPKGESRPRFSPDGRYLAFLSGREGKKTQVWLLNRLGGEAERLTSYEANVSDLAWSPDGARLALVVRDVDPDDPELRAKRAGAGKQDGAKTAPPIVIRRRQFKRDREGYLRELRDHVYVFDLAKKAGFQLTSGPYDDQQPTWSPDGKWIAFTSNRTPEPDSNDNTDIFAVAARAGDTPRRLTSWAGADSSPTFSPDGRTVAHIAGGDPKDVWYDTNHLAVVPFQGGETRPLTRSLDRNVSRPRFSPDGKRLLFLLEDGGNSHLAEIPAAGGAVRRLLEGERDVNGFDIAPGGQVVVLESQPQRPFEVSAVSGGVLRRLTQVNDEFLKTVHLGAVERFKAKSADGTVIDGFLTRPPEAADGAMLPTILRIHGGPVSQFSTAFHLEWQLLAAQGYAVVAANPRGSSGYGREFSRAIWADWGNKDFEDVMAAVDHVVAMGVADPERLGVGGWSYGGILTNYVITKTGRFKAAISGASEVNYLSNYGTDHFQLQWENELGLPWRNTELWIALSPWFRVEKIVTPTLILCGQDDMNVPLLNSEQLYQALRRLGRETELVIYPGQSHGIRKPSYVKDRYERYIAWYDKYLKPPKPAAPAKAPEATSLLGRPLNPPPLPEATRTALEKNLAAASADFIKDPDAADHIIWLGRRLAYLGRYREAIDAYTRGIEKHPRDFRLYRHRGHRHVTLRELDEAIADLGRAAELIQGVPDQIEPDGAPNARNIPVSTSHFNIWYHLGLAHYLKADFEQALESYRECLRFSEGSPDRTVATSYWLHMTLLRLGRETDAETVLGPIRGDLDVIEDQDYLNLLLMYKGEKSPEEVLGAVSGDGVARGTLGYGVANWYLINGREAEALKVLERVVAGPQWSAFGFIAAEAELARREDP
jgi:dipeptidyl aminopeptidase/acylaminoacyl peptidase